MKMNNMYDILGKMNLLESKRPDANKNGIPDYAEDGKGKMEEADYSAKAARAGKDIGKPGKAFATIAAKAGKAYGSAERGEKVAGAVLKKLRAKEDVEESGMDESALQAYLGKKKYGETGMKALQKAGREGASKDKMANIRAKYDKMDEADMEEGNKFTGNLMKARAAGLKKADLDGDGDMETVREGNLEELDMKLLKGLQGAMSKNQKDPESERNIHKKYGYRSDRDDTSDDDYDEHGNLKAKKKSKTKDDGPKKKGRPAGTGRKLGAKGPTGRSKLLKMKEDETQLVDRGEYDREGDMAKEQLHTIEAAAKELHDILGDDQNLPEWVQSKITKAMDYIDTARDYMSSQEAERGEEMPVAEKAVSKKQQRFMGMAHAMQKGEKIRGASPELKKVARTMKKGDVEDFAKTKHKGLPEKKKKEETEESTVAGSVAPAPTGGKGKKGMIFGKGVYESQIAESFEKKLNMLSEGMSINMSMGEDGTKSLSVNATDEDAVKLAQILKLAGLGSAGGYKETCPVCGQQGCGCEQMEEDVANSPEPEVQSTEYMTKTIAGGLNKEKRDIAGNGQTTVPVTAVRVQEEADIESHLTSLYKQFKAQ